MSTNSNDPALGPIGHAVVDHGALNILLGRYVRAGDDGVNRVDYTAWKASRRDMSALDDYLAAMQAVRPAALSRPDQFVFWINLYNAETLRTVLNHRSVRSILFIRPGFFAVGPWRSKRLCVDGRQYSLSDIENNILRAGFGDPRVHYALNCASTGCPNLRPQAWVADNLDVELDRAARAMINGRHGAVIKDGKLILSRIFKWYRKDFGNNDADVIAHLTKYADEDLAEKLGATRKVNGYAYDWRLNAASQADVNGLEQNPSSSAINNTASKPV